MERIMSIFYGNDFLPYKDKERTIHYPIVGNTFNGMNNVNELHFYVRDIGGVNNLSWVAIAKLPNGRILYELLTDIRIDHEIEENYVVFNVSQFYTQLKGEVYISLNGCRGEVEIETDQETGISTISGEIDDNTVVATGSIKLAINYAPQRPLGFSFDVDQYQNILNALANKSGVFTTIQVVPNIELEDLSGYEIGQLIYSQGSYYKIIDNNGENDKELAEKNGLLGGDHALLRFVIDDDTTLEELADFGKMFVIKYNLTPTAINEFLAYVNVVGSTILLYLLDIQEMKLLSYSGVASDTFADFLDSAEETTYVERQHSANILYGTNNSAQESALPYSVSISGDKIVQRDSSGHVKVPTLPTDDGYDAINKTYGDLTYGNKIEMTIDENFDLVIKLKNSAGAVISQADVDLPLESIVVSAQYYDSYTYQGTTYQNVIVITLATTSVPTIIPIGDLVSGLVDETTFNSTVTQLQSDINSRVAKKTTSGTFAYGHTNSSETEFGVTNNATSGTIPLRDTNGNIKVGNTPSNGGDATSKTYVDTFGRSLEFTIDNSTFVLTLKLKDNNGNVLSTQTVDLPLETMVVTGRYDDTTESLILELKNGQLITIPISDLISGLVTDTSLATTLANYYTKAQIDQMVSGFVFADVDDFLSTTSENPVENKVITQELEKKANKDGNYPTLTSGLAGNLDTKIVDNDVNAYNYRPTGGLDTESGNNCKEKAIVGGSLGFNQLQNNGNFASAWVVQNGTSGGVSNNVMTFTATAQNGQVVFPVSLINGHKFLSTVDILTDDIEGKIVYYGGQSLVPVFNKPRADWQTLALVWNATPYSYNIVRDTRASDWTPIKIRNAMIIDLTAMFGSTIADYIYSLEQGTAGAGVAWFRRYFNKPYYSYTPIGGVTNVITRGKKAVGFNQFAGNSETNAQYIGDYYISSDYSKNANNDYNCFRIKVNPNTQYTITRNDSGSVGVPAVWRFVDSDYNLISGNDNGYSITVGHKTTPTNCEYIEFSVPKASTRKWYVHYTYDQERDGEFEEYREEIYENDAIELIGIPQIDNQGNLYFDGNRYNADGSVDEKYGIVDLGRLTWTRQIGTLTNYFQATISDKKGGGKLNCPKYSNANVSDTNYMADKTLLGGASSGNVYIRDDSYTDATSFKNSLNGVYLVYELATPTQSKATPFPETQWVDNWGTEERLPPLNDTRPCEIPVGHDTDYPLDLKSKLEIMPNSPSSDGDYVLHSASGVNTYTPLGAWLSANGWTKLTDIGGYDSSATQTLKNVNGTLTWVND